MIPVTNSIRIRWFKVKEVQKGSWVVFDGKWAASGPFKSLAEASDYCELKAQQVYKEIGL